MPDINDPRAIKFCNEEIRPLADALCQFYWQAKALLDLWTAGNMGALITDTVDPVIDGAPADGRQQLTGARANAIKTRAEALVANFEANGKQILNALLQVAVNPTRR